MSLESLGSFIRQPNKENGFHRIYRAHLLQEKIVELLGAGVTVTLKGGNVRLWCANEQLAVLARLKKTRLLAQCHQTLGQADIKLSIKMKRA
ncbi:MAG: hypothetical protein UX60_C0043G0003 [Berkelbacteria bacterium GW2011_GWA2_46_7]|uniref:Uncharacterized protein n=1 Tax=Berkelbacteria bacterium GW2011_GWA2_46_7 TaxID=1618335 RepID=A0A0G1QD35_9BACT|nr:MAG: hypothetical protein UX60_C0043G0003 [Berkelbacteria bacterium GW2011_GWA2_46_7]